LWEGDRRYLETAGGDPLNLQLDLLRAGGGPPRAQRDNGQRELRITAALARHPRRDLVLSKVRYARRFFPELDGCALRVGLTRRAAGLAEPEGQTLWLNPRKLALHTIAHELTHLLQGRRLIPSGERSCDLFALARDASLVDVLPCYLELPPGLADGRGWLRPGAGRLLHDLAREAVARRARGRRRYIRWFEEAVGLRWQSGLLAGADRRAAAGGTLPLWSGASGGI
jgi:hypothetical protein